MRNTARKPARRSDGGGASTKVVWIEDVVAMIEKSASSEALCAAQAAGRKGGDGARVMKPVFVEDLVRNVALKTGTRRGVSWYKVEAENFESIHNHNAYASSGKGESLTFWKPQTSAKVRLHLFKLF